MDPTTGRPRPGGLLRLLRPGNALMAALGVLVGVLLADVAATPWRVWIVAPFAAGLVTAFGNVLNDVRDRDVDRRAHPGRPVASGRVAPRAALALASLLLAAGLALAFLAAGPATLLFAVAVALVLVLYELRLKAWGLPGNAAVAALVGATFPFGALAAGPLPHWGHPIWALASMAALATLAREMWKDVEDVEGDRAVRRTFAHRVGARAALLLGAVPVGVAVLLSVPTALHAPAWWPGWIVLLAAADLLFLAAVPLALRDPGRGQRVLKAAMLVALVAFASGPLLA